MSAFEQAFAIVVGTEGGYVDNPNDPGGATKYGVSHRAYPNVDIAALTLDLAHTIYRRDYWNRIRGDDLPPPLALLVFDAAINSGVSRAVMWLQTAVGTVPDGVIGPATLAAVQAHAGRGVAVATEFAAQRAVFTALLPTFRTFGLGWARRQAALPYHAMEMRP